MQWLKDTFETIGYIIVGVAMMAFVFGFGEFVSGQWTSGKKNESNDPSESP